MEGGTELGRLKKIVESGRGEDTQSIRREINVAPGGEGRLFCGREFLSVGKGQRTKLLLSVSITPGAA